jgi:hypothetical protein
MWREDRSLVDLGFQLFALPFACRQSLGLSWVSWGSDAAALFAANYEDDGFDFYTLSVNSSGVTLVNDYLHTFKSFSNRIHYDPGTKLIYANDGTIVNSHDRRRRGHLQRWGAHGTGFNS